MTREQGFTSHAVDIELEDGRTLKTTVQKRPAKPGRVLTATVEKAPAKPGRVLTTTVAQPTLLPGGHRP